MALDNINEVIGQEAFDQVSGMNQALKELVSTMAAAAEKAKTIQIGLKSSPDIAELTKQLNEIKTTSIGVNGALRNLESAKNAESAATRQAAQAAREEAAAKKSMQSDIAREQKNRDANAKATLNLERAIEKLTRQRQQEEAQIRKNNNAYEQLKIEYTEAANAAKKLGAEYFNLQRSGKASADGLIRMGQATREANTRALTLSKGLYEIERATGQSQRNVGNYNALMFETNQLLREAPNFALSARTGFMALSNNLPMFADQFKNVSKEIDETTGKMKGWKGALKEVGGALISWQTLLIVGITLLLQYGDRLTGTTKAVKEAEKANKKYKKSIEETDETERKAAQESIARIQILTTLATDNTQSTRTRTRAIKELQETYPATFGALTKQEILEGKLGDAINKTTQALLNRAAVQAAEKKFALASENVYDLTLAQREAEEKLAKADANFARVFKANNNTLATAASERAAFESNRALAQKKAAQSELETITKLRKDAEKEQQGYLKDAQDFAKKAGDVLFGKDPKTPKTPKPHDITNAELKAGESLLEAQARLNKAQIEADAAAQKEISDNQKNSLSDRLNAYQNYVDDQIRLYELSSGVELSSVQERLEKIADIKKIDESKRTNQQKKLLLDEAALQTQLEAIIAEHQLKINTIYSESAKGRDTIIKNNVQNQINELNRQFQAIKSASDAEVATELHDLDEKHKAGLVADKQYWKQRTKIINEGAKELYNWQAEYVDELFNNLINDPTVDQKVKDFVINLQGQFQKAKRDAPADKTILDFLGFNPKTDEDLKKSIADSIKSLYDTMFQAIDQAREKHYQAQFDRLDAEKQRIEDNAAAEKNAIEGSLLSQEEKAKKEQEIEARKAAQEKALDNQRKQLQRQQAQREKEDAIFKISIESSIAIAKTLAGLATVATAPYAIAAAALIAAQAAAQIALVSSRPIPEYWQGVDDHPGGLAVVGERGIELINLPSGKSMVTPDRPTLMNLPKHTEVLNHKETMKTLDRELQRAQISALINSAFYSNASKSSSHFHDSNVSSRVTEMSSETLAREAQRMTVVQMGMMQQAVNQDDYAQMMVANFERAIEKQTKKLASAIANKQETHFHWQNGELRKTVINGGSTTRYIEF